MLFQSKNDTLVAKSKQMIDYHVLHSVCMCDIVVLLFKNKRCVPMLTCTCLCVFELVEFVRMVLYCVLLCVHMYVCVMYVYACVRISLDSMFKSVSA